jgi:hypothetical protein
MKLRRIEVKSCYEEKRKVKKWKPACKNEAGMQVAKILSSGKENSSPRFGLRYSGRQTLKGSWKLRCGQWTQTQAAVSPLRTKMGRVQDWGLMEVDGNEDSNAATKNGSRATQCCRLLRENNPGWCAEQPRTGAPHEAIWTDLDRAEGTAWAESEIGKHTDEEKKINRERIEHWR